MLALHLGGLAAFWRYYHQPIWLALPTLFVAIAFPLWRSRRALAVETLAPLFFLYAVLIARVIAVRVLLANEPYADEASFADPRFIFFQIEAATAVAIAYTALVQVIRLTDGRTRSRLLSAGAMLLMIAALAWFALETIGHRTRGVTATDPYGYAQMAVDLATRGTPLHAFALFTNVVNLQVSWYPIEHIGYRLFDNLSGAVPTVWPVGGSFWIAGLYRLLGEEGLYLATPLAALASLMAFAFLALEYLTPRAGASAFSPPKKLAIAAVAVALLATSWEQVDRSIVPLVDVQAQLFSVLAMLFTIKGARLLEQVDVGSMAIDLRGLPDLEGLEKRNAQTQSEFALEQNPRGNRVRPVTPRLQDNPSTQSISALELSNRQTPNSNFSLPTAYCFLPYALLAGLSLGAAYFVRHTQLLLAVPMVVAVGVLARWNRLAFLTAIALAALVVALPDLWYHQLYLGSWLTPESHEMALFSISSVLPSLKALSDRFLAGNEFGYLIPFLLYGIFRAARDDLRRFAVLAVWLIVLVGFHLMYAAVKIRDLLPEYPAAILLAAYGMVKLALDVREWARQSSEPVGGRGSSFGSLAKQGLVAVAIFFALLLPAMRDRITIVRPFQPAKVTFGYVTEAQRASFDQITALTPADAIVGSTMNDGAIDLYARRATFRPGEWNAQECARFVELMMRERRDLYLLDDGAETSAARRELSRRYTLRLVAVLDVPLFGSVDGIPGALWEIQQ